MNGDIEETTFLSQRGVHVRVGGLSATILPQLGSNLISLRLNNIAVFREPETAKQLFASPFLYGMPILFPPNRIHGGTFTFNGQTYHLDINEEDLNNHLHGLLYQHPWQLVKADSAGDAAIIKTQFDSSEHPDVLRQFPHRFLVETTYSICENSVRTKTEVMNQDKNPFPWGLGYHTNFHIPVSENDSRSSAKFFLSVYKQWELNQNMLPTGELIDTPILQALNKGLDLSNIPLDHAFLSSVALDSRNVAELLNYNQGMKITYRADANFLHWVVYNADAKSGFISLEPYTWVTNAPNVPQPESLTGFRVLYPGESVSVETEIELECFSPSRGQMT